MNRNNEIKRPDVLDCDIHRIRLDKTEWLVFVGKQDGKVFELFVAEVPADEKEYDENQTLFIPAKYKTGQIIKAKDENGKKIYNLRCSDVMGFGVTFDHIGRTFDNSYYNYTINVSFMLRYIPNEIVYKVVSKWLDLDGKLGVYKKVILTVIRKYL